MSRLPVVRGDRGQTLPLYIWLTSILLFAGLAFFAWAQAASVRNQAQTAADAAALAAAQETRDELIDGLEAALAGDGDWLDWLDPQQATGSGATAAAQELAAENDATLQGGAEPVVQNGFLGYRVAVRTNFTAGESVIPGTESASAEASATAVLQPRCQVDADAQESEMVELDCEGGLVTLDPNDFDPADLPDAAVLFSVYLAD
ncbi:pilus assembly protein TadG-related protein [Streptomyces sp. NPDC047130]|uniref:pilus assembly protein TadG-related protein n=1 Tax=Streptomyces sp. NPDC047130 TaxID=3155261 RepID=UPI0034030E8D